MKKTEGFVLMNVEKMVPLGSVFNVTSNSIVLAIDQILKNGVRLDVNLYLVEEMLNVIIAKRYLID